MRSRTTGRTNQRSGSPRRAEVPRVGPSRPRPRRTGVSRHAGRPRHIPCRHRLCAPGRTLIVGCEAFLSAGDVAAGAPLVDDLERIADDALAPWVTCYRCQFIVHTDPSRLPEVDARLQGAIDEFGRRDDATGLAKAHRCGRAHALASAVSATARSTSSRRSSRLGGAESTGRSPRLSAWRQARHCGGRAPCRRPVGAVSTSSVCSG